MTELRLDGAVRLPDGAWVRGRGLRNPVPEGPDPEFGLYLGSGRLQARHTFEWAHEWLDWPDFALPRDSQRAVELIRDLHRRAQEGQRVEVACGGGVGRTGTVVASLAVLAGVPVDDAVSWTRTHYHRRAVETPWQRRWVKATFPGSDGHGQVNRPENQ